MQLNKTYHITEVIRREFPVALVPQIEIVLNELV